MSTTRTEHDAMGSVDLPADAYYGAQTRRAVENFPISGLRLPAEFIEALGLLKQAAAEVNRDLGLLERRLAEAVIRAAAEVAQGRHTAEFVVDVFQSGSGTSTNMNANEVIANRAAELLGGVRGTGHPVHPNDHVNRGQSSNDVIPSALHVAAVGSIRRDLAPGLQRLHRALQAKAEALDDIIKLGRTHLQDAVPIRLGQELSGYAAMVDHGLRRAESAAEALRELPLGGTAVGTGLNAHPEFGRRIVARISELTGIHFVEPRNRFEAQGARDAAVEASGHMRVIAVSLRKIADDIRWLASGPRGGLGELRLPAVQPGSSIMPGKVNPVIAESLLMVCAQVMGHDAAVAQGGLGGNLELNTMIPLIAHNLLASIRLLGRGAENFAARCVEGLEADAARCSALVEGSLAVLTALAPRIGHDAAAALARRALDEGRSVRDVAREAGVLPEEDLQRALDPRRQTEPGS